MTILPEATPNGGLHRRRASIPDATVARLPLYLRGLSQLADAGVVTCSSGELATATGVNSSKIRKDLSYLGSYGTRGVGYDVAYLRAQIADITGSSDHSEVVIVGAGNLGSALATYQGFTKRGIKVVALLDADPSLVGQKRGALTVGSVKDLHTVVSSGNVSLGVIATPTAAAQPVAECLVSAGVTGILNFAPVVLDVPDHVDVRQVDVAAELQILSFHEQRKSENEATGA